MKKTLAILAFSLLLPVLAIAQLTEAGSITTQSLAGNGACTPIAADNTGKLIVSTCNGGGGTGIPGLAGDGNNGINVQGNVASGGTIASGTVSGQAGAVELPEGAACSGLAGYNFLCGGTSTTHKPVMVTPLGTFPIAGISGSPAPGDCAKFDTNGYLADAGAPCGAGSGGGSGGGLAAGTPIYPVVPFISTVTNFAGYTNWLRVRGVSLTALPINAKIQIQLVGGTGISLNSAWIFATNAYSTVTLTSGGYAPVQITWNGGSASYTTAFSGASTTSPFILNSDTISGMKFDANHDYYVAVYTDNDTNGYNGNVVFWGQTDQSVEPAAAYANSAGNSIPAAGGAITQGFGFGIGPGHRPLVVAILGGY